MVASRIWNLENFNLPPFGNGDRYSPPVCAKDFLFLFPFQSCTTSGGFTFENFELRPPPPLPPMGGASKKFWLGRKVAPTDLGAPPKILFFYTQPKTFYGGGDKRLLVHPMYLIGSPKNLNFCSWSPAHTSTIYKMHVPSWRDTKKSKSLQDNTYTIDFGVKNWCWVVRVTSAT